MLGFQHPDLLKAKLTARQLDEWHAYFRLHPFGHDVIIQMMAQQALLTAVASGCQDAKLEDFMPAVAVPNDDVGSDEELADDLIAILPGAAAFVESMNRPPSTPGD